MCKRSSFKDLFRLGDLPQSSTINHKLHLHSTLRSTALIYSVLMIAISVFNGNCTFGYSHSNVALEMLESRLESVGNGFNSRIDPWRSTDLRRGDGIRKAQANYALKSNVKNTCNTSLDASKRNIDMILFLSSVVVVLLSCCCRYAHGFALFKRRNAPTH